MAITEAERLKQQAVVRRLEAAGFRAWPASTTSFDGTWAVRVTAGFPAKRLNSVNPLDPSDSRNLDARIEAARQTFESFGRPLLFRQSPLAPPALVSHLDTLGWSRFAETVVMTADLASLELSAAVDRIPIRDPGRYVEASLHVHGRPPELREGLTAILEAIRPPTAFFVREDGDGEPLAVALAIHDNDLAGLLDVAVHPRSRGQGIGRDLVVTALRYTVHKGAKAAWVQVEEGNLRALSLYRDLGFVEAYRYIYRAPPGYGADG